MEPAARSPSETDAARVAVAVAPEFDAARTTIAATNRIRLMLQFFFWLLSNAYRRSTFDFNADRLGTATAPPRHRRRLTIASSPIIRAAASARSLGDDTAPRSEGRDSTSDSDDTNRRLGTAHAEATWRPDFTFNVDGSRGLAYRSSVARDSNQAPAFAAVIGLLAYGSCVVIGLLAEFDHTVGGWSAAAKVSYGLLAVLTASLLGFGVMASVDGSSTMLCVSDLCARLGAILCTALLIVAFSCKMGKPWGCAAGVPFAAVVACAMGAIGIWGRARACVVGPRRRREPPGTGDENV